MQEAPKRSTPIGVGRDYSARERFRREHCFPVADGRQYLRRISVRERAPFRKPIQVEVVSIGEPSKSGPPRKAHQKKQDGKVIVAAGVYNKRGTARKTFPLPRGISYNEMKRPRPFRLPYPLFREFVEREPPSRPDYVDSGSESDEEVVATAELPPWKVMRRNAYVRVPQPTKTRDQAMCVCKNGVCGEDCLNRVSFIECDPLSCPFGHKDCGNRAIQELTAQLAVEPESIGVKIVYAGSKGFGLFATKDCGPHQLIMEYTGDVIDAHEMERRLQHDYRGSDRFYCLSLGQGFAIDSGRRGSEARFVNHSCNPNSEMQKWFVQGIPRVGLFAGENGVKAGQEFTYDYNFDVFAGSLAQHCYCGEPTCRGIIGKRPPKSSGSASSESPEKIVSPVNPPVRVRIVLNKPQPAAPEALPSPPAKRGPGRPPRRLPGKRGPGRPRVRPLVEPAAAPIRRRRRATRAPEVAVPLRHSLRGTRKSYVDSISSDEEGEEREESELESEGESGSDVESDVESQVPPPVTVVSRPSSASTVIVQNDSAAEIIVESRGDLVDEQVEAWPSEAASTPTAAARAQSPDAAGPSTEVPLLVPSPMGMIWQMFRVTPINKPVPAADHMLQGIAMSTNASANPSALTSPAVMGIAANVQSAPPTPTPAPVRATQPKSPLASIRECATPPSPVQHGSPVPVLNQAGGGLSVGVPPPVRPTDKPEPVGGIENASTASFRRIKRMHWDTSNEGSDDSPSPHRKSCVEFGARSAATSPTFVAAPLHGHPSPRSQSLDHAGHLAMSRPSEHAMSGHSRQAGSVDNRTSISSLSSATSATSTSSSNGLIHQNGHNFAAKSTASISSPQAVPGTQASPDVPKRPSTVPAMMPMYVQQPFRVYSPVLQHMPSDANQALPGRSIQPVLMPSPQQPFFHPFALPSHPPGVYIQPNGQWVRQEKMAHKK